ncbi:unnamed protein product [Agarophyton chilense]
MTPLSFAAPPPLTRSHFRSSFSRARRRRATPLQRLLPPRLPLTHLPRRSHVTVHLADVSAESQDAFLQCVQCLAVYHVEPEEIEGISRIVVCSACLHEWYASEDDLIWGDEQANAALALAAERGNGTNPFVAARGVSNHNRDKYHAEHDDGPITVFVGNLSFRATEEDLYRAFSAYGAVLNCEMPADSSGLPRGYAFVEMQSRHSGMNAINALHGTSIVGRDISLSEAKPKPTSARRATGRSKFKRKPKFSQNLRDERRA